MTNSEMITNFNENYDKMEEEWKTLENKEEKANMSWLSLSWCKRIRDRFDDYDPNEGITSDMEDFVDVENFEIKWYERVSIWRVRFNETH